jgi:hypothetical protein
LIRCACAQDEIVLTRDFIFERLVVGAGDVEGGCQPGFLLPQLLAFLEEDTAKASEELQRSLRRCLF